MRHRAGWLLGFASALLAGCLSAPVLWSPDGRWLAYTVAVRSDPQVLEPGWLFRTSAGREDDLLGWSDSANRPATALHRIWATRADTGVSVLLEESPGPLTSPAWSPDGKALAFARLVPEPNGRGRYEVVVQDAPDRKRVILKLPPAEFHVRAADLPGLTLAWSPDGRYLAVPWLQQTLGLAIIRADNGQVLKELPDAFLPSWSPDGSKLAFIRGGDSHTLHLLDMGFGPARQLAELGQVSQAPFWSRDKRWVMVVARRRNRRSGLATALVPELVRIGIDGGRFKEVSQTLPSDRSEPERPELALSFSFDPEGDHFFYTIDLNRRQSQVAMFLPLTRETRKVDNPVDFNVRISSLAVSPGGKTLAFRTGGPNFYSSPGLWMWDQQGQNRFTPLVPDDAARVEWIGTLVAAAREVLRTFLPAVTTEKGRTIERATFLPIPGELEEKHESIYRLRRLGRVGRMLCERSTTASPAEPAVLELIDEARLFFCYLSADYDAALAALETLEARTISSDHRLRLLSVRAQLYLARGQHEQAEQTIEFLRSLEGGAPLRVEVTPAGATLTEEVAPGQGWSNYLASRAKEWIDASKGGRDGNPLGHFNPDNPDPMGNLGNGAFPFAPGNFLDPRKDDVLLQNGVGDFPPAGFRQFPGGIDQVPPEFRPMPPPRRRGFRPRPPIE